VPQEIAVQFVLLLSEGGRGGKPGEEGAGSVISKVVGSRRKKGKITQHCTIFCNRKNAKRWEPTNTRREPGLKGMGSGRFKSLVPPLILHFLQLSKTT